MKLTFSHFHTYSLIAVFTITSVLASSYSFAQSSAFYKCIDANGETTYNDHACAATESIELISRHAVAIEALDCRIAQNFIIDSTARWQQGSSQDNLFETYGGANVLSTEIISIVDFIFSFSGQPVSVNRIIALATQRCEAGLFGKLVARCDTFPQPFIDSFGSCIKARQTDPNVIIRSDMPAAASNSFDTTPTLSAAKPVLPVKPPKNSRVRSR